MESVIKPFNTKRIYLLFLIFPVIQLGMSYYLSVFLLHSFYGIISFYIPALQKRWNLIIISTFLFLLKVFVEILNNASITDILLPLRHLVCFIGIIIISENLIKAHLPLQKVKLLIGCF